MHGQFLPVIVRCGKIGYNQATACKVANATPTIWAHLMSIRGKRQIHQLSRLQPVERFHPATLFCKSRDFVLTGATDWELLWDCWPAIVEALTILRLLTLTLMAFQKILVHRPNFDDWRLQGVSAYCGGLWLAA